MQLTLTSSCNLPSILRMEYKWSFFKNAFIYLYFLLKLAAKGRKTCRKSSMNHPQSSRVEICQKTGRSSNSEGQLSLLDHNFKVFFTWLFLFLHKWSPVFQRNSRTSCCCRSSFNPFLYTCFGPLLGSLPHTQQGFSITVDSHHWPAATTGWDHKCLMVLNLKVSLSFSNTSWQSQNHTKDPAFNAGTCHQAWSMNLINRQ